MVEKERCCGGGDRVCLDLSKTVGGVLALKTVAELDCSKRVAEATKKDAVVVGIAALDNWTFDNTRISMIGLTVIFCASSTTVGGGSRRLTAQTELVRFLVREDDRDSQSKGDCACRLCLFLHYVDQSNRHRLYKCIYHNPYRILDLTLSNFSNRNKGNLEEQHGQKLCHVTVRCDIK
jgi:hypothetical protein